MPILRDVLDHGFGRVDVEVAGRTPAAPGVLRHWLASYFPVYAAADGGKEGAGSVAGVACVFEEVTVQRATHAELERLARERAESLAILETLITGAPIGFAVLDPQLRYQRVNPALAEINGLPAEQHLGRTIREVVPGIRHRC